ncbi:MAG TPA: TonB family protein [Xanthomonadales bacterium]|nr:TonB family protein [Xanthomonadales bacterium]
MVAIEHDESSPRPSSSRVAAWSGAFALHVVVLGVLLAPIARPLLQAPRDRPDDGPMWARLDALPVVTPPRIEPRVAPTLQRPTRPVVAPQPIKVQRPVFTAVPFAEPAAVVTPQDALAEPAGDAAVATTGAVQAVRLATLAAPPPHYPSLALRRRLEGTVLLRVQVGADGEPVAVSIERSSGHRVLDAAAREQVLGRWHFVPAMRDGIAVPAIGLVPIRFRLDAG